MVAQGGGSAVRNLPAKQGPQVQSLGQEDPLKKGMSTLCSILAWRIPWTEEPGGLQSMGWERVRHLADMHGVGPPHGLYTERSWSFGCPFHWFAKAPSSRSF